jgi:superfamily I DNA/RNA helicase
MKYVSFYELNKNDLACAKRRKGVSTEAAKKDMENFQKSIPLYEIIKEMLLLDEVQPDEWYNEKVAEGFKEVNFPTEETRRRHVMEMAFLLERYHKYIVDLGIHPETDLPRLDFRPASDLTISGVSPNFIYVDGSTIHVVKISQGKPSFAKTKAAERKDLYALAQYGRFLIPSGKTATICAEYHFLRSSNDKTGSFISTYNEKDSNIIQYEQEYSNPNGSEVPDWDAKIIPELRKDEVECSEDDCKMCAQRHLCGYKHAPLGTEVPMAIKALSELSLSEAQEKAIQYGEGVLKINAGPGAGKTVVVCARTACLLSAGVKPEELLLITFTESGAKEMRDRIKLYTDDFGLDVDLSRLTICTFNAFGQKVIDSEWSNLGFAKKPRLIDDVERYAIIARLLNENVIPGIDYRNFRMRMPLKGALEITKRVFEIIKAYNLTDTADDRKLLIDKLDRDTAFLKSESYGPLFELYDKYYQKLRNDCLIEYADQENLIFEVLQYDPYFLEDTGIAHIIIDEFQDTSEKQMNFIKQMMDSKSFKSLMVVGDDSQAIFGFRDTTPEFMIHFFEYLGMDGEEISLIENHRSTPQIVNFANAINRLNKERVDKDIIPTREAGEAVKVNGFWEKWEEYEYIVEQIKKRIENGTKPEDIAFIASTKTELLLLSSMLSEENIPTILLNPEALLENSRVIAAIALSKWLMEPTATQEALNYAMALTKGELMEKNDQEINLFIEGLTQQKEFEALHGDKKREYFHRLLEELDEDDEIYESFVEMLKGKESLQKELEYCVLFEEYGEKVAVRRKKIYSGVVLTTAHSSKGLEWPVVFTSITKFYDKHTHTLINRSKREALIEEKRRLMFVAATRARDELIITSQFVSFGSEKDGYVYNQFLSEAFQAIGNTFEPVKPSSEERKAKKEQHERELAAKKEKKAEATSGLKIAG